MEQVSPLKVKIPDKKQKNIKKKFPICHLKIKNIDGGIEVFLQSPLFEEFFRALSLKIFTGTGIGVEDRLIPYTIPACMFAQTVYKELEFYDVECHTSTFSEFFQAIWMRYFMDIPRQSSQTMSFFRIDSRVPPYSLLNPCLLRSVGIKSGITFFVSGLFPSYYIKEIESRFFNMISQIYADLLSSTMRDSILYDSYNAEAISLATGTRVHKNAEWFESLIAVKQKMDKTKRSTKLEVIMTGLSEPIIKSNKGFSVVSKIIQGQTISEFGSVLEVAGLVADSHGEKIAEEHDPIQDY